MFKNFILKFAKQANELSEEIWKMTENESITGEEALKLSAIIELSPRTICWNPEEYEVESLEPGKLVLKDNGKAEKVKARPIVHSGTGIDWLVFKGGK